jgi:hypothetical protein
MGEWDYNENQGRRKDQVEFTYKVLFFTIILIISLIVGNSIYLFIK